MEIQCHQNYSYNRESEKFEIEGSRRFFHIFVIYKYTIYILELKL